jgi:hypothetical protein
VETVWGRWSRPRSALASHCRRRLLTDTEMGSCSDNRDVDTSIDIAADFGVGVGVCAPLLGEHGG